MKGSDFPTGERGAFDADARLSPTLPARYYQDPEIHRRELKSIFYAHWCYVGHASRLPDPGDYRVEQVADQCIFVIRGRDSRLRAFHNVCQHRGHQLLSGSGAAKKRIVCPYHAWTYGLDGELVQAPHTAQLKNFDPAGFSLKPVRLAECAGLLFANLDSGTPDFDQAYLGFEQTITDSLPGHREFAIAYEFEFDIAANWKIVVDNFSEGYHIPVAHRLLSQVLDNSTGSCLRREACYAFYESRSKRGYDGYEIEPGSPYRSWTLWPNTCLLSLPGCENLVVIRMAPDGADRCRERADLLAAPDATAERLEALKNLFAEQFNAEDIGIVESVHRGLKSLGYDQGRYVVDDQDGWYSESALHRFHRLVLDAVED
ncbi:MAG TPA: aromatic ring-hydroxylating dioxygenase subunit alpha [Gammaproteobacteria bacterium]|nr:aromatic ring-hydroxylating dioxygenase subunit alpha [Gammaproteobacteria bacterium]